MKRLMVLVLGLWGCPSDPATSSDPEMDQALADAVVDAARDVQVTDATERDARVVDAAPPVDDAQARDARLEPDVLPADMQVRDAGSDGLASDSEPPDVSLPDLAVVDAEPDLGPDAEPPPLLPLRCAPVRGLGGECYGDDRACEPGLTCISGFCFARSGEGGDCDGSNDCDGDLYCRAYSLNGEPLVVGICSRRGPEGEPCHRRNFGCEFAMTCLNDLCAPRSMVGGICLTIGDCDNTTWCNRPGGVEVGICEVFMPAGAECDPFNHGCGPNLTCIDNVCGIRMPMGGDCNGGADCQPGQYCDRFEENGAPRAEPVCENRGELGDVCEQRESSNCRQSRCIQGLCAADQALGAPCDSTFDCAAGGFCPQPR